MEKGYSPGNNEPGTAVGLLGFEIFQQLIILMEQTAKRIDLNKKMRIVITYDPPKPVKMEFITEEDEPCPE